MKKEQIDDFTKLNVDFEDLDLDIRTSDDDHYYMEYKLEKNGKKDPLTWEDKDGELTLKESEGGTGGYFITYDLGVFRTHIEQTQKEDAVNTVILYVPEKAQLLEAEIQLSDGDFTADYSDLDLFFKSIRLRILYIGKQDYVRIKLRTLLKRYGLKRRSQKFIDKFLLCIWFYQLQIYLPGNKECDIRKVNVDDTIIFRIKN